MISILQKAAYETKIRPRRLQQIAETRFTRIVIFCILVLICLTFYVASDLPHVEKPTWFLKKRETVTPEKTRILWLASMSDFQPPKWFEEFLHLNHTFLVESKTSVFGAENFFTQHSDLWEKAFNISEAFEWVILTDCDSLWIRKNLLLLLTTVNPLEPLIIGANLAEFQPLIPGFILSRNIFSRPETQKCLRPLSLFDTVSTQMDFSACLKSSVPTARFQGSTSIFPLFNSQGQEDKIHSLYTANCSKDLDRKIRHAFCYNVISEKKALQQPIVYPDSLEGLKKRHIPRELQCPKIDIAGVKTKEATISDITFASGENNSSNFRFFPASPSFDSEFTQWQNSSGWFVRSKVISDAVKDALLSSPPGYYSLGPSLIYEFPLNFVRYGCVQYSRMYALDADTLKILLASLESCRADLGGDLSSFPGDFLAGYCLKKHAGISLKILPVARWEEEEESDDKIWEYYEARGR